MKKLNPEKLHVTYLAGVSIKDMTMPRCYTLTHSDITGDLYLSIGSQFNKKQISNLYTKLMRDEVLAEWQEKEGELYLNIYCHICGDICFGWASLRNQIFRSELPLAIEAICNGDINFIVNNPTLKEAIIIVNFHATKRKYNKTENWGRVKEYILNQFIQLQK